jgi:hypothetical protein
MAFKTSGIALEALSGWNFRSCFGNEALHDQTAPDLPQSRPTMVDAGLVGFGYLERRHFFSFFFVCESNQPAH